MATPTVKVAVKHIEAAKEALDKKVKAKGAEFEKKNPRPDWKDVHAWRASHLDPLEKWQAKKDAFLKPTKEKADAIILDARMDQMTTEQLLKAVREF